MSAAATFAHRAIGITAFATGGKAVLSEKQELALSIGMGLSGPYTLPWCSRSMASYYDDMFQAIGKGTIKSGKVAGRAGARGAKRLAKSQSMKVAARSGGKLAARAIPVVGWGLLAYDVIDFAVGDDPSFFGDLIDLGHYMM